MAADSCITNRQICFDLSAETCYEAFTSMGIVYGPAHQGLEQIYVGDHEVLAKLTLPSTVLDTKDQFTLHPSLLDAAMQAVIGMDLTDLENNPFNEKIIHF